MCLTPDGHGFGLENEYVHLYARLAPFKLFIWAGLLLSSLPIHLLFNSAVFETNYEGSEWNLTIATEAFVTGAAPYFSPGASLANSGFPVPNITTEHSQNAPIYFGGWGHMIPLTDYWNESAAVYQSIVSTAQQAPTWNNLTVEQCWKEYRFCTPKKQYGNLVLIVEAGGDLGWTRSQVVNFNQTSSNDFWADWTTWDLNVPPNATNSLWYYAICSNSRYPTSGFENADPACASTYQCGGALGDPSAEAWVNTEEFANYGAWEISFLGAYARVFQAEPGPPGEEYEYDFWPGVSEVYSYNESATNLEVSYCLAESTDYKCKLGVSNALLLVVVLCTLSKVVLCTIVVWKLPATSLVTLGDAMESFIAKPDPKTLGLGTVSAADSHRLQHRKQHPWQSDGLVSGPRPRVWHYTSRRFSTVIPKEAWMRTYGILSAGVVLLSIALGVLSSAYHGIAL